MKKRTRTIVAVCVALLLAAVVAWAAIRRKKGKTVRNASATPAVSGALEACEFPLLPGNAAKGYDRHAKGREVLELQNLAIAKGAAIVADGKYGPASLAAFKEKFNDFPDDGTVSAALYEELNKEKQA